MSKPDTMPALLPWWRRVVLMICEYDKSGILKFILEYFGIAGTDRDRGLFLNDGSVNQGKTAGTINADVNFEGPQSNYTQPSKSFTPPTPSEGHNNVYMNKGSVNKYDVVDTVNASVTFNKGHWLQLCPVYSHHETKL